MVPHRVLYIVPSVGIGGVETFLKHVSQYHTGAYQPYFLLFNKGPLGQWLEANDATVFYCKTTPRLSRPWTWLLYHKELIAIIKNHSIDLVHSSMSYSAFFSWPAAFVAKHIWFQHGPVSGWMDKLAYSLPSSAILYNSEHTLRSQLAANSNRPKQKLPSDYVIHLGTPSVDKTRVATLRSELTKKHNLSEGTVVLSMACRLQRWKGVHVAIEAFSLLLQKTKRPLALLIYGDDSWDAGYFEDLKKQASNLPVYFSSPVEDVTSVFLSSDIIINSSTTPEPFGLTLIEAMACGALPVAPNAGGPQEILSEKLSDCLFLPNNPEDLAGTLLPFVVDSKQLQLAKLRSADTYEKNFTVEAMIGQIESCYTKVFEKATYR